MTDGEDESDADTGPDDESRTGPERGSDRPDGGETERIDSGEGTTDRDALGRNVSEMGSENEDRSERDVSGRQAKSREGADVTEGVDTTTGEESATDDGLSSMAEPDAAPEEIDVESLIGPVRRLDPRVRYVWVLGSVMGSLILGAVAAVVGFVVLNSLLVGPAAFLFVFALGAVLAVLRYRSWSYEVREDSLYMERGVLTHTRTVVPYVRIQHVDASRGPVERTLGLATVVVYTAGSRGADVSIPGLTTNRAEDLQERLKRLAIAAEGEDAV